MGNLHVAMERDKWDAEERIKYKYLLVKKGRFTYVFNCKTAVFNHYLGRYYPNAYCYFEKEEYKLNEPKYVIFGTNNFEELKKFF